MKVIGHPGYDDDSQYPDDTPPRCGGTGMIAYWDGSAYAGEMCRGCDDCEAPDPMITVADLDNLRHMLGVSEMHPRGYRNYFVAGGDDVASMERLVLVGFAVKNERYKLSSDPCYHATIEGARAIGLRGLPR